MESKMNFKVYHKSIPSSWIILVKVVLVMCIFLVGESLGIINNNADEGNKLKCKPEAIHLAFGNTSQEMVVMWATEGDCSTQVQYAAHAWHLNLTANGSKMKLDCQASNSTKFMHRVVLKNLRPGSTVYYRPISSGISNSPFYFRVPNFDESSHFIVFNELEAPEEESFSKALVEEAYSHSFTSLIYLSDPQTLIEKGKDIFPEMLSNDVAVSLPLMIGAGWGAGAEAECGRQMFSVPDLEWPTTSTTARWYSHDVGPVHIVRYSPEVFLEADQNLAKEMQSWMVADLTKVNDRRKETPWIIAMGLDPMYCHDGGHREAADCARNDSKVRHGLEDIFYSFAVDFVIEQQDGPYERTWPHYKGIVVARSYVEPAAPVEIIMGLGQEESAIQADQTNSSEARQPADWSAVRLPHGGKSYSRLTIANASHLHWELLSVTGGSVLDEIWLVQSDHGNFSLSSLPRNVSHQINQSIIAMGGKPGTYDFIGNLNSHSNPGAGEGWSKYSLWFGLALVGAAIGIGLGTVTIRSYLKRRRGTAGRRWQEVDRHGASGGHFYSVASDTDSDENENDFEIDMFERTPKSGSKLLTSY